MLMGEAEKQSSRYRRRSDRIEYLYYVRSLAQQVSALALDIRAHDLCAEFRMELGAERSPPMANHLVRIPF